MPSFLDHEIFHIYHEQVLADQIPKGETPGWYTMWLEGLATYVSQRMNPKLDAQHVRSCHSSDHGLSHSSTSPLIVFRRIRA
jgi:hypothetical protein